MKIILAIVAVVMGISLVTVGFVGVYSDQEWIDKAPATPTIVPEQYKEQAGNTAPPTTTPPEGDDTTTTPASPDEGKNDWIAIVIIVAILLAIVTVMAKKIKEV